MKLMRRLARLRNWLLVSVGLLLQLALLTQCLDEVPYQSPELSEPQLGNVAVASTPFMLNGKEGVQLPQYIAGNVVMEGMDTGNGQLPTLELAGGTQQTYFLQAGAHLTLRNLSINTAIGDAALLDVPGIEQHNQSALALEDVVVATDCSSMLLLWTAWCHLGGGDGVIMDGSAIIHVEVWETARLSLRSVRFTCAPAASAGALQGSAAKPPAWPGPTCAVARVASGQELAQHTADLQAAGWQRSALLIAANVTLRPSFDEARPVHVSSHLVWRAAPEVESVLTSVDWGQLVGALQLVTPGATFTAAGLEMANMGTLPRLLPPAGMLQLNQWAVTTLSDYMNSTPPLLCINCTVPVGQVVFEFIAYYFALNESPEPSVRARAGWLQGSMIQADTEVNPTEGPSNFLTLRCAYRSSKITALPHAFPAMPVYDGWTRLATLPNVFGAQFVPAVTRAVQTAEELMTHLGDPYLDALLLVANITLPDLWPAEGVPVSHNITITGLPGMSTVLDFKRRQGAFVLRPGSSLVLQYLQLENMPFGVTAAQVLHADAAGALTTPPEGTGQLGRFASGVWAVDMARPRVQLRLSHVTIMCPELEVRALAGLAAGANTSTLLLPPPAITLTLSWFMQRLASPTCKQLPDAVNISGSSSASSCLFPTFEMPGLVGTDVTLASSGALSPQLLQPAGIFDDWAVPSPPQGSPASDSSRVSSGLVAGVVVGGVVALITATALFMVVRRRRRHGSLDLLPPAAQAERTSSLKTLARWLSNRGGAGSLLASSHTHSIPGSLPGSHYKQASSRRTVASSFHLTETASMRLPGPGSERGEAPPGGSHSMLLIPPTKGSVTGSPKSPAAAECMVMGGGLDGVWGEGGSVRAVPGSGPSSPHGPMMLGPPSRHASTVTVSGERGLRSNASMAAAVQLSMGGSAPRGSSEIAPMGTVAAPSTPEASTLMLPLPIRTNGPHAIVMSGEHVSLQPLQDGAMTHPSTAGGSMLDRQHTARRGGLAPSPAAPVLTAAVLGAAGGPAAWCGTPRLNPSSPAASALSPEPTHGHAPLVLTAPNRPSDAGLARVLSLGQARAVSFREYVARELRTSEWAQTQADGTVCEELEVAPAMQAHMSVPTSRTCDVMSDLPSSSTCVNQSIPKAQRGTPLMLSFTTPWPMGQPVPSVHDRRVAADTNVLHALWQRGRGALLGPRASVGTASPRAPPAAPSHASATPLSRDVHGAGPSHARAANDSQHVEGVHSVPLSSPALGDGGLLVEAHQRQSLQHIVIYDNSDDSFDQPPRDVEGLAYGKPLPQEELAALISQLSEELRDEELRITDIIGAGTYGVVYKGLWRHMQVAVKTLVFRDRTRNIGTGIADSVRTRCLNEAAICSSLNHPGVVATYAHSIKMVSLDTGQVVRRGDVAPSPTGTVSQQPSPPASTHALSVTSSTVAGAWPRQDIIDWKLYLIMEYCSMGPLREYIDKEQAPYSPAALATAAAATAGTSAGLHLDGVGRPAQGAAVTPAFGRAVDLALQIAHGLAHVHSHGIVHSDINPNNVLLTAADNRLGIAAKIADFGLSVRLPTGQTSVTNHFHGTPWYTAGEVQATGTLSTASDTYSFGVLLWELAHGTPPWRVSASKRQAALAEARRQVSPELVEGGASLRQLLPPRHASRRAHTVLRVSPAVPEQYGSLITACLSEDPSQRPTAKHLVVCLRSIREQLLAEGAVIRPTEVGQLATAAVGSGSHEAAVSIALDSSPDALLHAGAASVAVEAGAAGPAMAQQPV